MKITFPPDNPAEAGAWHNSREFEALPRVFPVVTYLLVIWCVAAHFIAFRASDGNYNAFFLQQRELGAIFPENPWGDPIWKFFTTCFLHDGTSGIFSFHLIFNMMWLFQLGPLMERGLGSIKFLAFVVVTGFVSSALGTSFEGGGIGMSGIVYAMAGFMWTAWRRWTGFLEGFGGRTVKFMLFWQAIVILMTLTGGTNISTVAHMSGMGLGVLIGLWACNGNRYGWQWLVASIIAVAIGVTVALWSPWNPQYKYRHEDNNKIIEERKRRL